MPFYEMSLAFRFFLFVELLYIAHYSTKLCQRKKPPPKHLNHNLLMKSKLLLSFFTAPDSSSIKLKWLAEFLYVLHLHFCCSDFCSQTILLKSVMNLYLHCLFLSLPFSGQIVSFWFVKVFSTLSAFPLQGQKFYSSSRGRVLPSSWKHHVSCACWVWSDY